MRVTRQESKVGPLGEPTLPSWHATPKASGWSDRLDFFPRLTCVASPAIFLPSQLPA